jgi:D-hexose-6-phosphate mutarotase
MAPDDWRQFVCIESANVKERRLVLPPRARHTLTLSLAVDGAVTA